MTFTLLTPLPSHLAVGERAVIGVHVQSSEPFVMAIALSDAYYPGRGVLCDGFARAAQSHVGRPLSHDHRTGVDSRAARC